MCNAVVMLLWVTDLCSVLLLIRVFIPRNKKKCRIFVPSTLIWHLIFRWLNLVGICCVCKLLICADVVRGKHERRKGRRESPLYRRVLMFMRRSANPHSSIAAACCCCGCCMQMELIDVFRCWSAKTFMWWWWLICFYYSVNTRYHIFQFRVRSNYGVFGGWLGVGIFLLITSECKFLIYTAPKKWDRPHSRWLNSDISWL